MLHGELTPLPHVCARGFPVLQLDRLNTSTDARTPMEQPSHNTTGASNAIKPSVPSTNPYTVDTDSEADDTLNAQDVFLRERLPTSATRPPPPRRSNGPPSRPLSLPLDANPASNDGGAILPRKAQSADADASLGSRRPQALEQQLGNGGNGGWFVKEAKRGMVRGLRPGMPPPPTPNPTPGAAGLQTFHTIPYITSSMAISSY